MPATWLVSDTHFGHLGVCRFTRADGTKLRPWDTAEEMDEEMIRRWNETVRPGDKVYHLGDVVINRRALATLQRLNGDMVLIKGNHDIFKLEDYTKYFRDIRAYHVMTGAGVILSHIPLHPESHGRFGLNIHGHTHEKRVMIPDIVDHKNGHVEHRGTKIDTRYFCVCVEQTDFRPILLEEVLKRSREEGGNPGLHGSVSNWN